MVSDRLAGTMSQVRLLWLLPIRAGECSEPTSEMLWRSAALCCVIKAERDEVPARLKTCWAACCGQGHCCSHVLGSTWMIHGVWVCKG